MATIKFKSSGESEFVLEINTETSREGAHFNCYAGGNDYRTAQGIYEADKGYVIVEYMPVMTSQWGESGYSTMLMARDGNIEKMEKITENIDELLKYDSEQNNEKTKDELNWVRKYFFDYYSKITTTNSHFEINAYGKSREIKVLGVVVDTKTANIEGHFIFKVMKLISPEELTLLTTFFGDCIRKKESVTHIFMD
ncbi:hypothetical protein [uncultured Sphingobacterium sp.]|uniref:hypothetical protein n=1 Tax=uncultured Sphingobacterium sp. TaxID=182688 RepID=UPI003747A110